MAIRFQGPRDLLLTSKFYCVFNQREAQVVGDASTVSFDLKQRKSREVGATYWINGTKQWKTRTVVMSLFLPSVEIKAKHQPTNQSNKRRII